METHEFNAGQDYAGTPNLSPIGRFSEDKNNSRIGNLSPVTALLNRLSGGDREAFDRLISVVYDELHGIAAGYLRREFQNRTLQPTALIHEAYVRLMAQGGVAFQNRAHFFGE